MNAAGASGAATGPRWGDIPTLWIDAWRVLRHGGWALLSIHLVCQIVTGIIVSPVLRWLFAEAVRAAGLVGLDLVGLSRLATTPLSAGLIMLIVVVAFMVMAAQLAIVLIAVHRSSRGEPLFGREALADVREVFLRLCRPSGLLLVPYLFVLLPLGGLGFVSVLSHTIAIPSFISGELVKTLPGLAGYVLFLIVLGYVLARTSLTFPIFVISRVSGPQALVQGWRRMRGKDNILVVAIGVVLLLGAGCGALLLGGAVLPVMLADAVWPAASPIIAAIMLAVAELGGTIVIGAGIVMMAAILLDVADGLGSGAAAGGAPPARARPSRRRFALPAGVMLLALVVGSFVNLPAMAALSTEPHTLVLAHRGDTTNAVENSLSSLHAAHDSGVDIVEMDVLESADGGFVVMHDTSLKRLTGRDDGVADLTHAELTALTVQDGRGHSDRLPSLEEYVREADSLDQQLLIELKLHGREKPDLVPRLVNELEELGVLEQNIYHSLDGESVDTLKRLRPDLSVGYTMALAGVGVPQTDADFLVVEEWSLTPDLVAAVDRAGLGLMVWTVNDEQSIRSLLRDDVGGIITHVPALAVASRVEIAEARGMADVLLDAVRRYVVIF